MIKSILTKVVVHVVATATLVLGATVTQASPVTELDALLSGHEAARANFTQFALNSDGNRAEDSSGHFVVARPNRFRWVTETPFVQEIVSDGDFIWIHDPDLEQVTRKPANGQNNSAPAMILNGQIEQLSERFDIARINASENGVALYELKPLDAENATFTRIRLLFEGERISELSMEDSLGQRSMLVLDDLEYDPELEEGVFAFIPPEGADVILDPGQ
ncbi:outer membrane lipoprotein chaperone LolA [Marinobacterium weihaiense]|uniref:Outer-membrane lipoprotein carrier protein n=1 Tax=Marinobacterium weihaiense TaxID=2851016 RepID=A0ABS6M678_9GAMM|nr:outer membrane lipoprotein chaperone LolA [Marinobacterium weihaiense]MBV0931783.1 outer membrane lipoprotein chaperone LolA [Marinobacterium weihaiense]